MRTVSRTTKRAAVRAAEASGDGVSPSGRVNQKARTRRHIAATAIRLRDGAGLSSLAQVAEEAEVSRATIYRYFSSIDDLRTELALSVKIKEAGELFRPAGGSPLDRVLSVHSHLFELVRSHEADFRAYLRGSMEHWQRSAEARSGRIREGRRARLIDTALGDTRAQLAPDDYEKLVRALSLVMFIEPYILLKDIFGLDDREADETMRWSIERLLAGALAVRRTGRAKRSTSSRPSLQLRRSRTAVRR